MYNPWLTVYNIIEGENGRLAMYNLDWFEFMKYRENETTCKYKVVVYGHGQWFLHMMDWRGCNFWHGRLPGSPVFNNEAEAFEWLRAAVKKGAFTKGMELKGHHSGEYECGQGCDSRELGTVFFDHDKKDRDVYVAPNDSNLLAAVRS